MRVANRLFFRHVNHGETEFTLLYSDSTAVRGRIAPLDGTDGENVEQIRFAANLLKGHCSEANHGIRAYFADGSDILFPNGNGTHETKNHEAEIKEVRDRMMIEEFSRHICREVEIIPVQHGYTALVHQKPELANNFLVSWALGNTCNFACSYCPTWLHDGTQPWRDYELVKGFCERLISQVPATKKIVIEFSGGEVTLWNDYLKLCRFLKSQNVVVSMITNGYRSLEWWQENYSCFDVVQMSYHTEFARRDHFHAVCDFLKNRVDLRVYVMMPPAKVEESINVGTEIANLGVCVALKPITEDLLGELVSGYSEEILKKINHFNATLGVRNAIHGPKPVEIRNDMVKHSKHGREIVHVVELISKGQNTWYGWQCSSGLEQIVIDAEGYVYRGWCKVGNRLGHIADPAFRLPDNTVLCDKEICNCPFDMFSTKISHLAGKA